MGEATISDEKREWPTHCPRCGTKLESAAVEVVPGGDEEIDTIIAQDFCPNPDCPGKVSDLAPASDPEQGARANLPGSLGGDNGGG